MKYAIMSDVHANPLAFETVLADAKEQGCRRHILLGDLTGYGYDAASCIDLAKEICDVVLLGNHDSACLGLETGMEALYNPNYRLDHEHRKHLADEQADWLRARPYLHEEKDLAFAHGDFVKPEDWNYIFEKQDAVRNFCANPAHILFCGHTHHTAVWDMVSEEGSFQPKLEEQLTRLASSPESVTFTASKSSRYVVNVGSVGYPRNDLCISYVVYDSRTHKVTFRRLPFDFSSYIQNMLAQKYPLPRWLMQLLEQVLKG